MRQAGVTAHVGERFLNDPVGCPVHIGREGPFGANYCHRHREPRRTCAYHQAVQLAQAAAVTVLRTAQHAERRAQLPRRVRAGLLDRLQRRRHLLAALVREVFRHARLNLDHRDAVRQRIVQLAGDPQPLLHRPALGRLVSCPFRLIRPPVGLADVQLPHAERHRHDARRNEPSGCVEPLPAAISAHSSSVRILPASASARGSYCRYSPRGTPASCSIRADQAEVTSGGRRRRAVRPRASHVWQRHFP